MEQSMLIKPLATVPVVLNRLSYTRTNWAVLSTMMEFVIGKERTLVRTQYHMRRVGAPENLLLNGNNVLLKGLWLDGRLLKHIPAWDCPTDEETQRATGELAEGQFEARRALGGEAGFGRALLGGVVVPKELLSEAFTVEVCTEVDPSRNKEFVGLYLSKGLYLTQCEAYGFRSISLAVDRPDVLSKFTVKLVADRVGELPCPVLLCNGNNTESGEGVGPAVLADSQSLSMVDEYAKGLAEPHFAIWSDPHPKPTYLFAVVCGALQSVNGTLTTKGGLEVAIRLWAQGDAATLRFGVDCVRYAMQWDERTFGLEYDLEVFNVVAADDFNQGAMENKSLNIFNSAYLVRGPLSTDADFRATDLVIAHEYFHNWTGNRVTVQDWFQLTSKEGLTDFRQQWAMEDKYGPTKRIQDVARLRGFQFAEDRSKLAQPIRPDQVASIENFYTSTVYDKGAEVVRLYAGWLGLEGFKKGLKHYLTKYDGQAVGCDDFRNAMAEANGRDLAQFERWYSQSGTPHITVKFDPASKSITLTQAQTDFAKGRECLPLPIPVRMQLWSADGKALLPDDFKLEFTEREQTWTLPECTPDATPSLLRGFSAPVVVEPHLNDTQLLFLLRTETDAFAAWEAGHALWAKYIKVRYGGDASPLPAAVLDAWRAICRDQRDDASAAQRLALPAEGYLATALPECDPLALYEARRSVKAELAAAGRVEATARLAATRAALEAGPPEPIAPHPASAHARALYSVLLDFLLTEESARAELLAWPATQNFTLQIAAAAGAVLLPKEERDARMAALLAKVKDDNTALCKWFAIQAGAPRPLLADIKALTQHPAADMHNPNLCRSILGTYVRNPFFHAEAPHSYAYLVEQIAALDKTNKHTSCRLLEGVLRQNTIAPRYWGPLKEALETLKTKQLSLELTELLNRL